MLTLKKAVIYKKKKNVSFQANFFVSIKKNFELDLFWSKIIVKKFVLKLLLCLENRKIIT